MANVFEQAKRKAREADILDVARRHGVLSALKKVGNEYIGPCPVCGGTDRFGINPRKEGKNGKPGLFVCRRCGEGGDAIDLERFLSGTKFKDAVKDLSGAAIVEEDPGEAARRARWWAFCRAVIEETVAGLRPVLGSPGEIYLRDERAIDTSLPAIQRALETVAAVGWHPSVYFAQKDPNEPFHELHGQRLGCIVGIMTDPATGERLGPISRTYLFRGKQVGKAKTLKRAESERLGVVTVSPDNDIRRLGVNEGFETALAFLEMGGLPVWSTGSDGVMRFLPVIDGVDELLIGADNDARAPGERGASERAGRALRVRWLGAGRKAQFFMPPGFKTDFNDVLIATQRTRAMSGTNDDDFAARVGAGSAGGGAGGWDDDDEAPEFSDEDLALRFAGQHVYTMRHVSLMGRWFLWTGKVWMADEKKVAFSLSRQVVRAAARECNPMVADSIASARTVAAVERLAQADPRLATTVDVWDADPWLLNTPDGVVDLRTGKLRAHSSGDFMTQITAVGPSGDCPRFKQFLLEVMADDKEMVAFIQRMLGYCLTGDISEEIVCFIYGTGQNGKGVLTSTVEWIMADYCKSANDELFTQTHNDRHPTEVARLKGARMVLVTEVEEGRRWDEAKLKKMTGGDTLTARLMRQDFFQFKPQFKPVISGNHKPQIKSVDVAMRRRINLVPFSVTIPSERRDNKLKAKLRDEGPGILQWLIEGCLEYQRLGLSPPQSVVDATDLYFKDEDSVANWIEERCEVGKGLQDSSSRLFASWKHYAEKAGLFAGNNKRFKAEMNRLGYHEKRLSFGVVYEGLHVLWEPHTAEAGGEARAGRYDPDHLDPF